MDNSGANGNNPQMRQDNPFAPAGGNGNLNQNPSGSLSDDPQLAALRQQVDGSAYATSSYDRANAFSVANTREQPQIAIGGSATALGGLKEADLQFLSNPDEPQLEPEPEPEPMPTFAPESIQEPVTPPAPQPQSMPAPEPELPPEAPQQVLQPIPQSQSTPQPQPMPQTMPAPQPYVEPKPQKQKSDLSLPLIIVIVIVVLLLIGGGIWGVVSIVNGNKGNEPETPAAPVTPTVTEETIGYEEYNKRIEERQAMNCTASYSIAKYTDKSYAEGEYELLTEKAWTIAANDDWTEVFVSNFDATRNLSEGSIVSGLDLKNAPVSVYFSGEDAYLWSVTDTVRAAGDGSTKYRLGENEKVAASAKVNRAQFEAGFEEDFYEYVKLSADQYQSTKLKSMVITCKSDGIDSYAETLKAHKTEIDAKNAN